MTILRGKSKYLFMCVSENYFFVCFIFTKTLEKTNIFCEHRVGVVTSDDLDLTGLTNLCN